MRIVGPADRGSGTLTVDDAIPDTDALVTASPGVVLAILTADCVPIVLHDPVAGVLACVHAGWRGTVARVCTAAVAAMTSLGSRPQDVIAGLGPAAAPARYQVGPDVDQAVTEAFGPAAPAFIHPDPAAPDHWLLDLWAANQHVLKEAGLPAAQIHATSTPTGPIPTGPSPPASGSGRPRVRCHPCRPTDPVGNGFFSDRAVRPCGRLALVASLPAAPASDGVLSRPRNVGAASRSAPHQHPGLGLF